MSDQLFTNYGYVKPTRTSRKGRTRAIECAIGHLEALIKDLGADRCHEIIDELSA